VHGGPHSGSDLVARPNHYTANTWSPANDEPRSTLDQNHQAVEPVDSTCEHRTCSDTNPDGARTGTRIIASSFSYHMAGNKPLVNNVGRRKSQVVDGSETALAYSMILYHFSIDSRAESADNFKQPINARGIF